MNINGICSRMPLQQQKSNCGLLSVSEASSGHAPERRVPGGCTVWPAATPTSPYGHSDTGVRHGR